MNLVKNLESHDLQKIAVDKEGGIETKDGVLVTYTNEHTGRSPNAKFIVYDNITENTVDWSNNQKITKEEFSQTYNKFLEHMIHTDDVVYSQEVKAVRRQYNSINVSVYTEFASHSLFARNMFVPASDNYFISDWKVYHFPSLINKPTVLISFENQVILISGTLYAGEIKKSVFTVLNYTFPEQGYLPMHCSVNVDKDGSNPTIFFGLSGTGKTTLSADTFRVLIGDDEHGWTDSGLTNFEGGCYAKTIKLSKSAEPEIWDACHTKGAMLENVVVNDGIPDFDDAKYTENGRASYPTSFISNAHKDGFIDKHPNNIVMLTCDAFGVLPPVMKLTADEAVRQFLLGYTAKVAGTEKGVTEPVATFSPCFGLPFMPRSPEEYGELLRQKIKKHKVDCWLVNTGWTGGPYGKGRRMPIKITREIIKYINNGELSKARLLNHKYTGFDIPIVRHNFIPANILEPEKGWASLDDYIKAAKKLKEMFSKR